MKKSLLMTFIIVIEPANFVTLLRSRPTVVVSLSRVAFSVSTSRSRDGLETHPWSRLVSSRIFLAMSRSRLGLGNLDLESRLGLVAYRLGL